jgi:hypothetical protein
VSEQVSERSRYSNLIGGEEIADNGGSLNV